MLYLLFGYTKKKKKERSNEATIKYLLLDGTIGSNPALCLIRIHSLSKGIGASPWQLINSLPHGMADGNLTSSSSSSSYFFSFPLFFFSERFHQTLRFKWIVKIKGIAISARVLN